MDKDKLRFIETKRKTRKIKGEQSWLYKVCLELKKDGYAITSKMDSVQNRWGEKCRVKRYFLEEEGGMEA